MLPSYAACGIFFGLFSYGCFGSGPTALAQNGFQIAPASGDVDIRRIKIVRCSAQGAVKEADLTNMEIELWFGARWEAKERQAYSLVDLQSLSAIEDNTGKLLSTPARRDGIDYLFGEARATTWGGSGDREGPPVTLLLDAPARGAEKIKALKGTARVSLSRTVNLTFRDLAAINGKFLEHPDLRSLRDMKLSFTLVERNGEIRATVSAPVIYASPWRRGRLDEGWEIYDGEKKLTLWAGSVTGIDHGVSVEKSFRRQNAKGLSLRLTVLEPVETKTFHFDFRDVPLP